MPSPKQRNQLSPAAWGALGLVGAALLTAVIGPVVLDMLDKPAPPPNNGPPPPPSPPGPVIRAGESVILTFSSGEPLESGRQTVHLQAGQAGQYALKLESANPALSGHWMVWDHLSLKEGKAPVWEIGEDETPTDYSPKAFSELCDPKARGDCVKQFTIGSSRDRDFPSELNDGQINAVRINFSLTERQARSNLALVLSTLYSTHPGIDHFKMKVALEKVE